MALALTLFLILVLRIRTAKINFPHFRNIINVVRFFPQAYIQRIRAPWIRQQWTQLRSVESASKMERLFAQNAAQIKNVVTQPVQLLQLVHTTVK